MNKLNKGIRIVILTVMTIIGILLIIGYFDLALCKRNYTANIKERLETTWEVKLPEEMKELYNCYQPTFTGRACQYVVLSCNDNDKKQFNSMFAFKPKDEESVKSLQSIFDHMNMRKRKLMKITFLIYQKIMNTMLLRIPFGWLFVQPPKS